MMSEREAVNEVARHMTGMFSDLFGPSQREIYARNPLVQVICQLRFPTLLNIQGRTPVDFQEMIRAEFPLFERLAPMLPQKVPPEVAKMLGGQLAQGNYQFLTDDKSYVVTLTPESLALSTAKYTVWDEFRGKLRVPLDALEATYRPSFYSRLGLRYQNAIDRRALGVVDVPWSRLFRREILGELAVEAFERQLENVANRSLRLSSADGFSSIMMMHGLGTMQGSSESIFFLDLDIFTERRIDKGDAIPILDKFNESSGQAFRWCISDELRRVLEPG
jgi:uncharacterized protein (TIGR04255 family)